MFSILAFGDSITFGLGATRYIGWAEQLKKYFQTEEFNYLYNLGIPGDTSAGLLERIETEANARIDYKRPENKLSSRLSVHYNLKINASRAGALYPNCNKFIILIAIGTNDSKGINAPENINVPLGDFEKNIDEIITRAKKYTQNVVLIGLPPVDESRMPLEDTYFYNNTIQKYNEVLKKTAEQKSVEFCEVYNQFSNDLLNDGLHPNDDGYKLMFEVIKGFLVEKGLIT